MLPIVYARDENGVWHVSITSYPSTTTTACHAGRIPVTEFTTSLEHVRLGTAARREGLCKGCFVR